MSPSLRAALLALGVLAAAAPVQATAAEKKLSKVVGLAPARFRGTAQPNTTYGPITMSNGTSADYAGTAYPVLLGQLPDSGAFVVRDDAASRKQASEIFQLSKDTFDLNSGSEASVIVKTKGLDKEHGAYGGVLFVATPKGGTTVQEVLRLNATFLLDPVDGHINMEPGTIGADQAGPSKINIVVPV